LAQGWFEDGNRTTHFIMHYVGRPLEIAKGKAAIEVNALTNLLTLIDAVCAGEREGSITAAAAAQGQVLNRRRKSTPA
jgi:hypothetical protein